MKKICLVLSILLAVTMLAACAGQPNTTGTPETVTPESVTPETTPPGPVEPPAEAPRTKIIMATEAGFAPYEYYDESGNVVGVDPDIAKAIAEAMGIELEIQEMAFDAIIPEVKAGRVDFGAAGLTVTEDREKEVDFSITYATSKQIVVVRADEAAITGPDTLDGKTVGVQLGTVADYELTDNFPQVTVERYNKYFEAMADLENGRLDAIAMDILPAMEFVAQNPALKILDAELLTDEYAICVQKGNQELLDQINTVLGQLIGTGKIDEFTMNHTVK